MQQARPLIVVVPLLFAAACGSPTASVVDVPTGTDAAALDVAATEDVASAVDAAPSDTSSPVDVGVTTDAPAVDVAVIIDASQPDASNPDCPTGSTRCSGECVTLSRDPMHCGACGNACPQGQVCATGRCALQCPTGTTNCAGACRDLQSDTGHCGMCGNACAAGDRCVSGSCRTECPMGQQLCAGVCRAVDSDPAACGRCDNACPARMNATSYCAAGMCGSACRAGFGDCDGDEANGCEAALDTVTNCGGCGRACAISNASASCDAGRCVIGACSQGYADCNRSASDGCEANTQTDPSNCGACGRACAGGQACLGGTCVERCPTGQTSCSGACTNTAYDPDHCGACGRSCPLIPNTVRACGSGVCVPGVCVTGFADCNRNPVDGCEVSTGADVMNCGACGTVCNVANGNAVCRDGACGFGACNAGFASCDGDETNGCETNLASSNAHCGACGNACGGGQVCRDSTCVMAGGFSTDWVLQMGTRGQYTRCASVSASGSQVTCTTPEIRYGTVTGGVPYVHSGNQYATWCTQLGFRTYVRHTTGSRDVSAPRGRLFGCTSYDESVWHWCDWSDGTWYNQRLDYHSGGSEAITSIVCSL